MKSLLKFLKRLFALLLLLVLAASGYFAYLQFGGATHDEIYAAVREEGEATRLHINLRTDMSNAKLERIEDKLDRLDAKLERLLKLADTPMPDGMMRAE